MLKSDNHYTVNIPREIKHIAFVLIIFHCLLESYTLYAENIEIPGFPEELFTGDIQEYDVLEEGLIVKNSRIYISTRFKDSSADIGSAVYTSHYINNFLLPDTVKFNERNGEVYYLKGDKKVTIGKRKRVLGIFSKIVLYGNAKIITSPYGGRLIITYEDPYAAQRSTMEMVEDLLSQRCTQCHTAEYIFKEHKGWTNDDWLHVLHRMQSKGPALLSDDEVEILAQYLAFQRNELRPEEIQESERIKKLKQRYLPTEKDIKVFGDNKCTNCHTIGRVLVILHSRPWSTSKWTDLIKKMKGKDPKISHEMDVKEVVNHLYRLKKSNINYEN